MKVLFCGGGTAGHITPSLAIAEALRAIDKKCSVVFVSRKDGGENLAIERMGYPLCTLALSPIQKRLSPKSLWRAVRLFAALPEANRILKEEAPDAVLATGGYVCLPIALAAKHRGIPLLLHEANAVPGSATRALYKRADRLLLGFPDAEAHLPRGGRIKTVGNPVEDRFFRADREAARRALGIPRGVFTVLSFGGSLGAEFLNQRIIELMGSVRPSERLHLIHACGKRYYEKIKDAYPHLLSGASSRILPYIEDMPTYLAAADLVISRAGASTIAEICALGVPSILIPSPNVALDHQRKNAEALSRLGGCITLTEEEATAEVLKRTVMGLANDDGARRRIAIGAQKMGNRRCAERIAIEIKNLIVSNSALK